MIDTIIDLPLFSDIQKVLNRETQFLEKSVIEKSVVEKELEKNILNFILECLYYMYASDLYIIKHPILQEVVDEKNNYKCLFAPIDGKNIKLVYADGPWHYINGMYFILDSNTDNNSYLYLFYNKYFRFILDNDVKDLYKISISDGYKMTQAFILSPYVMVFPVKSEITDYINKYLKVINSKDYSILDSIFIDKTYNVKVLLYLLLYLVKEIDNIDKSIYDQIVSSFTNINNAVVSNSVNLYELFLSFTASSIVDSIKIFIEEKTNNGKLDDIDKLATVLAFFTFMVGMANNKVIHEYRKLLQEETQKTINFYR